jgi:hypothetical protein
MSALAFKPVQRTRRDVAGGGRTLADVVASAWEGLAARTVVSCPACGAHAMRQTGPGRGGCGRCGAELS